MTNPLRQFSFDVKSSDGEDGIIQKIFEIVGTKNKWCVELGALNGTHDSNSWNLINTKEWSAVLIEGDRTYFEKVAALYARCERVHTVNAFVSFEGENRLDTLLGKTPIQRDFDLFVLDIDGNDYHIWGSLVAYRPRVVSIEFNPTIPNDISFIQKRDMKVFQGSSLQAITKLAQEKGYRLVATTDANAFFVIEEEYSKFNLPDDSLDFLHPSSPYYTRLYQLYDGTLVLDGYKKLLWHNIPIDEDSIQVLPRRNRKYHARISDNAFVRKCKYVARRLPPYSFIQRLRKRMQ